METDQHIGFFREARCEWDRLNPILNRHGGERGQQLLSLLQESAIGYFAPLRFAGWLVAAATRRLVRSFAP